ncbi:MAG: nitroreductase [Dehalococcoidia bacterium]|nr:nitroreductase [Dehalococcoidia bacterium]
MDVLEAIMTRQMVPGVKQDPIPRDTIERLLEAAVRAPNHYLNQPWRFIVISGKAREELGAIFEASLREQMKDEPDEKKVEGQAMGERTKMLRAPVVIAVGVKQDPDDKRIPAFENVAATAAATQNLLLAAHGLGLGAYWRSGNNVFDPKVKEWLGLAPEDELISFVYLGYPDADGEQRPRRDRESIDDKTRWLGFDS